MKFLDRLENSRPFSEREAWGLFRLAAFGEAVGWTFLITALLIRHYNLIGHEFAVPVGGQIHGILFVIYFGILIATYSSLRWPRQRFIAAVIAGVVPYGSLVFEQWVSRKRRNQVRHVLLYSALLESLDLI